MVSVSPYQASRRHYIDMRPLPNYGWGRITAVLALALLLTFPALAATTTTGGGRFSDVPSEHPQANAIEFVAERGWLQGYPDGSFQPDREIKPWVLVVVLERVFPSSGYSDANRFVLAVDLLYRALQAHPDSEAGTTRGHFATLLEATAEAECRYLLESYFSVRTDDELDDISVLSSYEWYHSQATAYGCPWLDEYPPPAPTTTTTAVATVQDWRPTGNGTWDVGQNEIGPNGEVEEYRWPPGVWRFPPAHELGRADGDDWDGDPPGRICSWSVTDYGGTYDLTGAHARGTTRWGESTDSFVVEILPTDDRFRLNCSNISILEILLDIAEE